MPTSYSSNYQLKLIGTGLEAGTWGTSTNANWEKIEAAIGGSATITLESPPTGSTYASNELRLVTNALVDPGDSGSEPRSMFLTFTNTNPLTTTQDVRIYGEDITTNPNRLFFIKNNLNALVSPDNNLPLTVYAGNGITPVTIPWGATAILFMSGGQIYNGLENLLAGNLNMSNTGLNPFIYIPTGIGNALRISDVDYNSGTGEFENNEFLRIGSDATPSIELFRVIQDATEKAAATFISYSDVSSFGADTVGTTPIIRGQGTRGLKLEGGSTGTRSSMTLENGTNSNVSVTATGTGEINLVAPVVVAGTGSVEGVVESSGNTVLRLRSGNTTNGASIALGQGASTADMYLTPGDPGGFIQLNVDVTAAIGSITSGVIIPQKGHLNWGGTPGAAGYGIRGNAGVLEVKSQSSVNDWGVPYNSGMVSGDGTFYESSTNLGGASSGGLTDGFAASQAHILGRVPRIIRCVLRCIAIDHGWAVGDEIDATATTQNDEGSGTSDDVITFGADSTNIYVACNRLSEVAIANKSGGSSGQLTLANWDIYVYAWK
jgi:hypothetical protein